MEIFIIFLKLFELIKFYQIANMIYLQPDVLKILAFVR